MESRGEVTESSQGGDFAAWCEQSSLTPLGDWGDFLRYARRRVKGLAWSPLPENADRA
jgi:hypothetical protein